MSERQDGPSRARTEMFVEPLAVEDGVLVGRIWSTVKCCLVPVRAELPLNLTPGLALAEARAGRLVLPSGSGRMRWLRD
jgi:hypothetical protein